MTGTVDVLLDSAEKAIRSRGYHGVSFRELADDIGIKSASVHYYFPQKEDLAVALVERYSKAFFDRLNERTLSARSSTDKLRIFCQAYRAALAQADQACLCGMLGAESCGLPESVSKAVVIFFENNIEWLLRALPADLPARARRARAAEILAAMQGGMMIATTLKDPSLFDTIIKRMLENNTASN
jgi:TetR/AcrR family transcriptional regulator, transcriptional repressor for nem operon